MTQDEWKAIRGFLIRIQVVVVSILAILATIFGLALLTDPAKKRAEAERIAENQRQNKAQMNMIMQSFGQVIESLKKVEGKALLSEQDRATIHKQLNELKAKL